MHQVKGFREVVVSVRNSQQAAKTYMDLTGWDDIHQGALSSQQLNFWNLSSASGGSEVLLANPGDDTGYMRLVQFDGIAQRHIRSSAQSWDTGGIYDLDVRVVDIEKSFTDFQAAGWNGYHDPMEYEFGEFHISEVLVKGPEDVVFALIQRHKPTLTGYPNLRRVSYVFNSSQIVSDMDKAKDFYLHKLGFKVYMEENLKGSDRAENLFGVPQNIYTQIERNICIVNPEGINEGSVELVQLKGIDGTDFSAWAKPPHLGLLLLRFPVVGINSYYEYLQGNGVEITKPLEELNIKPYGRVNLFAVRSPDGSWLEFYENQ